VLNRCPSSCRMTLQVHQGGRDNGVIPLVPVRDEPLSAYIEDTDYLGSCSDTLQRLSINPNLVDLCIDAGPRTALLLSTLDLEQIFRLYPQLDTLTIHGVLLPLQHIICGCRNWPATLHALRITHTYTHIHTHTHTHYL
jgi:hypothetical protein